MTKSVYHGRTFKMWLFSCLLLTVIAVPVSLLPIYGRGMSPTTFYWGAGATAVAILLVIAGGQSAATFTASADGFSVSATNYLLRIRRTRNLEWSEVARVEQVGFPTHINSAGSNVGGHYLIVHLLDGSSIRVVGRNDDSEGYELTAFRKSIEEGIASAQGASAS